MTPLAISRASGILLRVSWIQEKRPRISARAPWTSGMTAEGELQNLL